MLRNGQLGGVLIALGFVATLVAYPLPATGVEPLFGFGTMFYPIFISTVALLVAAVGGVLLARGFAADRGGRVGPLTLRVLLPSGAVAAIGAYLVFVAGFAASASFIRGGVVVAVLGGVLDEFVG